MHVGHLLVVLLQISVIHSEQCRHFPVSFSDFSITKAMYLQVNKVVYHLLFKRISSLSLTAIKSQ